MTKRSPSKTTATEPKIDAYERLTNLFVEALETAGNVPSMWPWVRAANGGIAVNVVSGKPYNGLNRIFLGMAIYASAAVTWGTYRQWEAKGAQVRKGEHGTPITYWGDLYVDAEGKRVAADHPNARKIVYPKTSIVFHAQQVDGWNGEIGTESEELAAAQGAAPVEALDAFIRATGVELIVEGDRAYYAPGCDHIVMPDRRRFRETFGATATENWYGVAFHELTHWTGHEKRLNRDLTGRFGEDAYAFEELIAEIGSSFLNADHGLAATPREFNVQYVANWLRVLKNDKRAIFTAATAATAATKAATYVHSLQPSHVADEADEEEPQALAA